MFLLSQFFYDSLAKFFGSVPAGIIKFSYKQIVKITGHSCQTVASAFLTCKRTLEILYPDSLLVRGEIKEFGILWQERVKRILIDNANNDRMIIFQEG
jgi:hypothetical protein